MKKSTANSVVVTLANGLTRSQVENAKHVVYGLDFGSKGFYVGQTNDFVTRYFHHYNSAWKDFNDRGCNSELKAVMKSLPENVFILGVADNKDDATTLESLCIRHYGFKLNSNHVEPKTNTRFLLTCLSRSCGQLEMFSKKNANNSGYEQHRNDDKDRSFVICEIVKNRSSKRVLCVQGAYKGLFVNCSKSERERFNYGDKVKIEAAIATNGKQLIAPKTAKLFMI